MLRRRAKRSHVMRPPPAPPAEPFAPQPFHFESESVQRLEVAGDAVVGVVTSQLAAQRRLLVAQFPVPMIPAPLANSPQRSAESVLSRLSLDHPSPLPGASPVVGEPQHHEAALSLRAAPRRLRRSAKLHHPCLVRVQPKAVFLQPLRQHPSVVSRIASWNPHGNSPVCSVDESPGMTKQSEERREPLPSPFP